MTTRDMLLATYLLLNAALEAIDYADAESDQVLDPVFCALYPRTRSAMASPRARTRAQTRFMGSGGGTVARMRARTASASRSSVAHADRKANGQPSASLMSHSHASWYGRDIGG